MSTATQPIREVVVEVTPRNRLLTLAADYAVLLKLRVTSLVMMAACCGFYLASVKAGQPWLGWKLLNAVLAIGLVSGGAAATNQVMERDLDAKMRRTAARPIPMQRVSVAHALTLGIVAIVGGVLYLGFTCNWLAAGLAALTSAAYVGAYTPLKRHTTICTFVGAFPGAMPPLLGWVAVRGALGWEPLALFAIVFAWQFPHFHSIAWLYREDYERANVRMLAVEDRDGRATLLQVLGWSLALIPISLAPVWLRLSGKAYGVAALVLGAAFLWAGIRLAALKLAPSSPNSKARARQLLQASVFYLPLLFGIMMWNALS
jgi:protoheme IX farnesyltransferase